jgi:hypothetical protein
VKSADLYREAAAVLTPWMRANGYKRIHGGKLRYFKPLNQGYFVITLQIDKYGYIGLFGGSEFVVTLQVIPQIDADHFDRYPYPQEQLNRLLSAERLEELRALQNQVIARLTPPAPDDPEMLQLAATPGGLSRDGVIKRYFSQHDKPYRLGQGEWFRFADAEDVRRACEFVIAVLPETISAFFHRNDLDPAPAVEQDVQALSPHDRMSPR